MKSSRHIPFLLVFTIFYTLSAFAQPGFKVDIEKPKPYEERKLKSEKTGEGKLKGTKRILQNLTTRFNYYFNANNKINEVLDRAKEQHKDDYGELLSFYNYDLEQTAADSAQLDSVVYKARTGLANHDLRNEWTDELYLLWAQSWHLQKKFDSAGMMLQFINYAYAPQYEEGFYKAIGTHEDGAQELSIATKEDKKFLHNNNFSRNTAFIWQIRTLVEQGNMTKAGSLLTTLRRDPAFPRRLANDLEEAEAYWNYRQQRWDSAAVHLLAALDGDYPKLEKARWRYLAAQLLEKAGKPDEAVKLYGQVVSSTPDPVMEVYARLNLVRLDKNGGEAAIDQNLAELLKMAKKDKYEEYRDIIYYMAAQMEMERNNIAAAGELLIKGSKYNNGNQAARNKAFLQIADVSYDQKKYIQAAAFYDSVQVAGLAEADARRVSDRKPALKQVVLNSGVVERQDSLQRIAALPQEERDAYVKALTKKLRKARGLKEETAMTAGTGLTPFGANPPADLFASQQKGEWYFYNSNTKAQGAAQFKAVWGNRPNVDNWRRSAVVRQQTLSNPDREADAPDPNATAAGKAGAATENDLSFEGLSAHLPTTPEALKSSNDSIRTALFALGTTYLNEMEDLPSAIATFEELRRRFPEADKMDEVLFNLYYAYNKTGNATAAAQMKKQLNESHPSSRFTAIALTGNDPQSKEKLSAEATRAYEDVYNLFIEGRFADAEAAKRTADSTYKTSFWQPQLLYIESVYYIRQRQDSAAKTVLQTIIRQNSNPVLTEKAKTMIDVLSRRQQIEDELTRLQITRPPEDDAVASQPVAVQKPVAQKDTVESRKLQPKPAIDSLALANEKQDSIAQANAIAKQLRDSIAAATRDSLALAKEQAAQARKDSLARKALAEKERRDSLALAKAAREQARRDSIALHNAMLKQASDSTALSKYYEKRQRDSLARATRDSLLLVRQQAAQALRDSLARKALAEKERRDSLALAKAAREQARRDSIALHNEMAQRQKDSIALARLNEKRLRDSLAKRPVPSPEGYIYNPDEAHYAVVVLNKVDPIFVNEAKNAFFRYNQENASSQALDVQILNLTADTRLLLIGGLPSAKAAAEYVTRTKALAASEIIPWLTGNKYSFTIISAPNLEILKTKTDLNAYQTFLEKQLPAKF